ncbi:DNA-directed RNA polymerase, omega subunit [uncultured Caudovirales phage]|uniref:DNA-directed RNA polymerase n=1 Tax=uncultured Caudovirales phage TaxID=2100421 RepID=A0A6J5KXV8_9CAUD|nr:DNA-directed RNA polymerase, omega subunit [uncultured Caudovirales phage]CAB5208774.1 DNA-directed RNA polymerase, omega subunit [uncultured Caudovirales phage]
MKPRVLSRGPEVDIEKCVRNTGSGRFDMVLIACARAREIKRQNRNSDQYEHRHTIVTALKDIESGLVDAPTYFAKVPK